jgi:hypothetical protein
VRFEEQIMDRGMRRFTNNGIQNRRISWIVLIFITLFTGGGR